MDYRGGPPSPQRRSARHRGGQSSGYWSPIVQMVGLACAVHLILHWHYLVKMANSQTPQVVNNFPQRPTTSVSQPTSGKTAANGEEKTVLVLGALSLVGRNLVQALLARGDNVVVTVTKHQTEEQMEHATVLKDMKHPKLQYFQGGEYSSYQSLKTMLERHRPQRVCHVEIFDQAVGVVDNGNERLSVIRSLTNVLELSRSFGVRNIVFVSKTTNRIDTGGEFDTRAKHLELLGYGYHHQHGLNVAALRLPLVYGPLASLDQQPLVLVDRLSRNLKIAENQAMAGVFFDLVFVSDAVRGIMAALDRHEGYDTYDIATGTVVGWPALVAAAETATGKKAKPKPLPINIPNPAAIDTTKAKRKLGFVAEVSLNEGLQQTMKWYNLAYPSSPDMTTTTTAPSVAETSGAGKKICFVTAVFGDSVEEMDQIPSAFEAPSSISQNPDKFTFLLFTNRDELRKPGWRTVVLDLDLPNNIIKSRFPKFMSWRLKFVLDECRVVFYADGGWLPNRKADVWERFATKAIANKGGLIQLTHTRSGGPVDELSRIAKFKKDSYVKIRKERTWLIEQPDFVANSTIYCNMAFGYDPHNNKYQELSSFFWNRYSSHKGTWRDQPLWSYTVMHYNVTPAHLGYWPQAVRIPQTQLWRMAGKVGFNNHTYVR